jgi:hypothetical protein
MNNDFDFLVSLWKNYNNASLLLTKAMGGAANEVGEFAEKLVCKYFNATQLNASNKSADLITEDGKLIQVKSRKIEQLISTSLNVIRSWDFDILVVVLFSKDGNILKAIKIDSVTAKGLSKNNKHQNGYILTTSHELLDHNNSDDITMELQNILNGNIINKNISKVDLIKKIKQDNNIVIANVDKENKIDDFEDNENSQISVNHQRKINNTNANSFRPSENVILEFVPSDEKVFKDKLIEKKKAKRTYYFSNNEPEDDIWHADSFTKESNLRGNIWSSSIVKKQGLIRIKFEIL